MYHKENMKTLIKNAQVYDSYSSSYKNTDLLIEGGNLLFPAGEEVISDIKTLDLSGKFVLPALIDMHTHYYGEGKNYRRVNEHRIYNRLFLAYGVTAVRSMGELDYPTTLRYKELIAQNKEVGPDIFSGGEYFDALPSIVSEFGEQSDNLFHLKSKYMRLRDNIDFVKIYDNLPPQWIDKLRELAWEDNKKLVAHLGNYSTIDCIKAGVRSIEHGVYTIWEFMDFKERWPTERLLNFDMKNPAVQQVIDCIVHHDVACTPTTAALAVYSHKTRQLMEQENLWRFFFEECRQQMREKMTASWENPPARIESRKRNLEKQFIFVEKLRKAKARVFCGTDCISALMCPGAALSLEAEWLIESGYSNAEIINILTLSSAHELGIGKTRGSIEKGKRADLLITNSNPLDKISNLRDVHMVFKQGIPYRPKELLAQAEELCNNNVIE